MSWSPCSRLELHALNPLFLIYVYIYIYSFLFCIIFTRTLKDQCARGYLRLLYNSQQADVFIASLFHPLASPPQLPRR